MKNKNIYIFPTDTVYGIGCSLFDEEAQADIYKIKSRKKDKPFAVLCSSLEQIKEIAIVDQVSELLINKFMPGALTLILPAKEKTAKILGIETVGVRIPNHVIALNLIDDLGPMTTTSVNKSGNEPLNDYYDIVDQFGDEVENIYKNKYMSSNLSSSVVFVSNNEVKVLREGAYSEKNIKEALNSIENEVISSKVVKKNN